MLGSASLAWISRAPVRVAEPTERVLMESPGEMSPAALTREVVEPEPPRMEPAAMVMIPPPLAVPSRRRVELLETEVFPV